MKKLFSTPGFTLLQAGGVFFAFKSIYTVFFLILATASASAQTNKKDSTAFNKWEVSVDLKPLFGREEPYNLFVKRYLTERKVIRLGLWNAANNSIKFKQYSLTGRILNTVRDTLLFLQSNANNNPETIIEYQIGLGFQYYLFKHKLGGYILSDLMYSYYNRRTFYEGWGSVILKNDVPIFSGTETFEGYDPTYKIDENAKTYSAKLGFGVNYKVNRYLSIAIEAAAIFQRTDYYLRQLDKPFPDTRYERLIYNDSNYQNLSFNPMVGLYVNCHF